MKIEDIKTFIKSIDINNIDSVSLKLIRKHKENYEVFQPSTNNQLRKDVKFLYSEVLNTRLFELPHEKYNPTTERDGYLSVANLDVANVRESIRDIEDEGNINGDMSEINLENINFYCTTFTKNDESLYIFRRFTKMKKIRRGILGVLENNSIKKIKNKLFIGLDSDIDIIVFREKMLIINRFSLQTMFNLDDYFIEVAERGLSKIEKTKAIDNFNEFKNDCLSDRQAAKRMTNITNVDGHLEVFLEKAYFLPEVIIKAKLDLELNESGQIIYTSDRIIRNQILSCITDAYYESLLFEQVREDSSL